MLYRGVAILDIKANGKDKEFQLWNSMISRCYSEKEQKRKPTYIGCIMSDNFKKYSYFKDWCSRQKGFGLKGWEIDKDFLSQNCKIYSENTCVFIPHEINTFLTIRHRFRGKYPVGVDRKKDNGRFRVRINVDGKSVFIGYFNDEVEAFKAYKMAKEKNAKDIAKKWKGLIDDRVYHALMNYKINISD